jgi:hypothetical protein
MAPKDLGLPWSVDAADCRVPCQCSHKSRRTRCWNLLMNTLREEREKDTMVVWKDDRIDYHGVSLWQNEADSQFVQYCGVSVRSPIWQG